MSTEERIGRLLVPPNAKSSPLKNKKVLIIAAVALLVVGYFFLRSRSAAPGAVSSVPNGSAVPQTASDAAGQSTDQSSADLLAALAGENQQLMKSFLDSSSGLVSLAGSSFGSFSSSTGAGEPSGDTSGGSTTSTPFDTSTPIDTSTPAASNPIASSLSESAQTAAAGTSQPFTGAALGPVAYTGGGSPGGSSAATIADISSTLSPQSVETLNMLTSPLDLSNVQSQNYDPNAPFGAAPSGPTDASGVSYQFPTTYQPPPTITTHEQTLGPSGGGGNLAS